MMPAIDLRVLQLLSAKLCHDLIGPVAAISNGAELLADEEPEFVGDAIALVGDSAKKASRRLQFYRFAFGFSGGGLAGPQPHQLVAEFFADGAIVCDYTAAARALAAEQQQLGCVLLALAGDALPRGGRLGFAGADGGLQIDANGQGNGLSPQIRGALTLAATVEELTSRTVSGYFAGLLAAALGRRLAVSDEPGGFRIAAAAR